MEEKRQKTISKLLMLPSEMLGEICQFSDTVDVVNLGMTCKRMYVTLLLGYGEGGRRFVPKGCGISSKNLVNSEGAINFLWFKLYRGMVVKHLRREILLSIIHRI